MWWSIQVENTKIDPSLKGEQAKQIPKNTKEKSRYAQEMARKRFRARAAIEPTISHSKRNHSLGLNFLKGVAVIDVIRILEIPTGDTKKQKKASNNGTSKTL